MDRAQNRLADDVMICGYKGCTRVKVFYCKLKNIAVCVNCYQDYFLREKVTRIETAESAQQVLDKVGTWLKVMDKYEDKYNIERLHPHYVAEIRDYEGKLNELITRLTRAKRINNFVEYSEITDDGYKLLIELFESHAMKHFKDHVTQNYFSSKTNDNSFKIEDLLQIKLGDKALDKLKEDLTIELENKFNRDTEAELTRLRQEFEAERERLREEFEARYSQTFHNLKSKADKFEAKNNELGVLLEEKKTESKYLKEQNNDHKLENEGLINSFEEVKRENADLKTRLDSNVSAVGDLKKELDENKKEVDDLQKANSDLNESSKKDVYELNEKVDKLKEEKKEKEEIIDKMEEENKTMQAEIENCEKLVFFSNDYLCNFYKSKTGRDGKTGKEFYLKIDLRKDEDKEVLGVAKAIRFREVRKIHFDNICEEERMEVLEYLMSNCPLKVRIFAFESNSYGKGDFYLKGIEKMASITTKEVFIRDFILSKSSLEIVIKAGCNSDRIVFCRCTLDFGSDIDISGPEYKTTYLSFRGTGYNSNWSSSPSRLKKILKAISLSSLKTSLQTLDVYACGLGVSEIKEMLKEFNLQHVKVIEEGGGSLIE